MSGSLHLSLSRRWFGSSVLEVGLSKVALLVVFTRAVAKRGKAGIMVTTLGDWSASFARLKSGY